MAGALVKGSAEADMATSSFSPEHVKEDEWKSEAFLPFMPAIAEDCAPSQNYNSI